MKKLVSLVLALMLLACAASAETIVMIGQRNMS